MCKEQATLQEMAETMTWDEIGAALGVSGALVWKVANGRCGAGLKLRKALGTHHKRYRLALEFDSKEQRDKMARRLQIYGQDRKEQSLRLLYNI
jgi:hypothetical protein